MSAAWSLSCLECGRVFPLQAERLVCVDCSSRQLTGQALRGILELVPPALPDRYPESLDAASWVDWLPLNLADDDPAPLVGATPLLPVPALRRELGLSGLWVKDDSRNPSASSKDRASWLVCHMAVEFGCDTVATASTGNAASALACMCAAFGLRCVLFVPASAPTAKLDQMRAFGAELQLVDGDYDDAFEASMRACARQGWFNRNTGYNPYTIEGKKTIALEISAQLHPIEPDVLFVGAGDGVILHGIVRGLLDLQRAGLLSRMPRVIAVQSEHSDALWRGWQAGTPAAARCKQADSVADSLNVKVPRNAYGALRALSACGGDVVRVADARILEALLLLARTSGVFAEPAGAASLAGCLHAREAGLLRPDETAVLVVTGSGLKDPAAARELFPPPGNS